MTDKIKERDTLLQKPSPADAGVAAMLPASPNASPAMMDFFDHTLKSTYMRNILKQSQVTKDGK